MGFLDSESTLRADAHGEEEEDGDKGRFVPAAPLEDRSSGSASLTPVNPTPLAAVGEQLTLGEGRGAGEGML